MSGKAETNASAGASASDDDKKVETDDELQRIWCAAGADFMCGLKALYHYHKTREVAGKLMLWDDRYTADEVLQFLASDHMKQLAPRLMGVHASLKKAADERFDAEQKERQEQQARVQERKAKVTAMMIRASAYVKARAERSAARENEPRNRQERAKKRKVELADSE